MLTVDMVFGLIQGVKALIDSARAGHTKIVAENGEVLTPAQIDAKFGALFATQAQVSTDATQRIDDRRSH